MEDRLYFTTERPYAEWQAPEPLKALLVETWQEMIAAWTDPDAPWPHFDEDLSRGDVEESARLNSSQGQRVQRIKANWRKIRSAPEAELHRQVHEWFGREEQPCDDEAVFIWKIWAKVVGALPEYQEAYFGTGPRKGGKDS